MMGLYIVIILQALIIGFALWLIYSLNEKIMIMGKSNDVYDYDAVTKKTEEDEPYQPEDVELTELDTDDFYTAIKKSNKPE